MKPNLTKDRLLKGQPVFGCMMQHYRSAEIPRLLAAAGFDFLFIDTEHGGFDLETVQDLVRASNPSGITPLVRVSELLYSLVARVLDVGAQGIIFPRVEDPRVLEQAIGWTQFPPQGTRGFGIAAPLLDYEQQSFPEIIRHLNANTLVVVQFESQTSMAHCDELLSVPGIDVALVGPSDLSISLGVPGEFEDPKLIETVVHFVEVCRRHNIAPGIQVRTAALAKAWTQRGMQFVGCGSEHSLLLEKARETVSELRKVSSD
jgi:2-keto-3-deoxy-L-rhamnonate aldolase RhmA